MQSKAGDGIIIGVTGGIGSGKTTAARYLRQLGSSVLDADHIAKRLYRKNSSLKRKLVGAFGSRVLNGRRNISIPVLREIAFSNKRNQSRVGRIVHPFVISQILRNIRNKKNRFIVVEAALIFETNFDRFLNYTILVHSGISKRIERIVKRNKVAPGYVMKVMKLQMHDSEKLRRADFVIHNDGTLQDLKRNVRLTYEFLKSILTADV